ncbi:hypothetical protein ACT7C7_30445 [Bacillus cereus]
MTPNISKTVFSHINGIFAHFAKSAGFQRLHQDLGNLKRIEMIQAIQKKRGRIQGFSFFDVQGRE